MSLVIGKIKGLACEEDSDESEEESDEDQKIQFEYVAQEKVYLIQKSKLKSWNWMMPYYNLVSNQPQNRCRVENLEFVLVSHKNQINYFKYSFEDESLVSSKRLYR